jgi:hypothetical protein
MNPHDRADIAGQIASACSDCQVLCGIETICVDHEVAVILIYCWCLAAVAVVEEFGECFLFDYSRVSILPALFGFSILLL